SVDCSGLVRVVYFDRGILALRDARHQIGIGKRIEPENLGDLQRGDLLFFSNTPDGRISHVAIYDTDGRYIHSSGLVKTNMMSDDDPDYSKRYYRGASRIVGMEDTPGIVRMINHPWYFNIK
ncbi:MAG: C40 family peptidase, partial [Duncaniella sp.]|nr:C40 family peptidase [Duncaniella sp.]